MAITASEITTANTLEQLRGEFNNLVTDVTGLESGTLAHTEINTTTISATTFNLGEDGTFVFEGATSDAYETTLTVTDPTADRTITLPNETGTVLTDASSINATTFTVSANNATSETVYPIFVDGATGTQGAESDTGLSYNPSTELLTVGKLLLDDGATIGVASSTSAMTVASTGIVTFVDDILLKDAATIGNASVADVITLASTGIVTFVDDIVIKDGGTIGTGTTAGAITIAAAGAVTFSAVPVFPDDTVETADIQDNAVSLAKMAGLARGKIIYGDSSGDPAALAVGSANYVLTSDGTDVAWASATSADPASADGDTLGTASAEWSDLYLADGGVVYFGNDQEITLTHVADDGLLLKHVGTGDGKEPSLTFQAGDNDIAADDVLGSIFFQAPDEGAGTDAILVAAGIEAVSEGDFAADNNATKLSFKTAASEAAAEKMALSSTGVLTLSGSSGSLVIPDDGNIGSASDADAIAISSAGVVALSATTEASAIGTAALTVAGGIGVTKDMWIGDDIVLDSDAAVIKLGADQDVTITHNADTGVTLNSMDISGVTSINNGQIGGRRNYIYNGDTSLCQRATNVTGIGNGDNLGYYVQDRWAIYEGGAVEGEVTMTRATEVPDGFQYSMKFDCTTAESSVAADEVWRFNQILEGQDLYAWKKGTSDAVSVTLSFWVNATKTGINAVSLYDNDNSRHISKTYTVDSADTWEYKTLTYAGDTTGTWDRDNAASLYILFYLAAGSNLTSGTLATSWAGYTAANTAVGQVNNLDSTSNNFHITGLQLELGDTASAFQHETYGENLARCQRYYNSIPVGTGSAKYSYLIAASTAGGTYLRNETNYPVTMRSTTQTNTQTGAGSSGTLTGVAAGHSTANYVAWQMNVTAVGNYSYFSNGTLTNDCEL